MEGGFLKKCLNMGLILIKKRLMQFLELFPEKSLQSFKEYPQPNYPRSPYIRKNKISSIIHFLSFFVDMVNRGYFVKSSGIFEFYTKILISYK